MNKPGRTVTFPDSSSRTSNAPSDPGLLRGETRASCTPPAHPALSVAASACPGRHREGRVFQLRAPAVLIPNPAHPPATVPSGWHSPTATTNPFAVRPGRRATGRAAADAAATGADRHRPATRRRWAAERSAAGRVGRGQPQYGAWGLCGLEAAGLVASRQGRGTFVAEEVSATPEFEEMAAAAIRQAEAAGLSARRLAEVALVCAEISPATPSSPAADAIAGPGTAEAEAISVRRELRRQIGVLEAKLAEFARDVPLDMPTAPRVTSARVAGSGSRSRRATRWSASSRRRAAPPSAALARRPAARSARRGRSGTGEAGPLARAMGWWRQKH